MRTSRRGDVPRYNPAMTTWLTALPFPAATAAHPPAEPGETSLSGLPAGLTDAYLARSTAAIGAGPAIVGPSASMAAKGRAFSDRDGRQAGPSGIATTVTVASRRSVACVILGGMQRLCMRP